MGEHMQRPPMNELLDRLDAEQGDWLRRCGEMAAARGGRAYLVGGSVRDLVLEREHADLDVVVEGNGMGVAQDLARALDGELTRHQAFQTAIVTTPAGLRVDVATARREEYRRPGQLPQVVPGSLEDDLERRDFTINTMAISLSEADFGAFFDPHGGRDDLEAGLLRVMHARSFADDPTRVLRALRFSLRFDYSIEPETRESMNDAITGGYLDTVSGDRVRRELTLIFTEAPVRGAVRLETEGALAAVHPGLRADQSRLRDLEELLAWYRDAVGAKSKLDGPAGWVMVLGCCAAQLSPQERWQVARHLRLSRADRAPLIDAGAPWRKAIAELVVAPPPPPNSVIEAAFRGVDRGALLVAAATAGVDAAEAASVRLYLTDLHGAEPALGGLDLKELGVPEGPRMGEFLEDLRAAKLDGDAATAADERRLVTTWMAEKPL